MATLSEALALAIQHHQAGRLPAAEQIYQAILRVEPNYPEALHLLGVIAHQRGQHSQAVDLIARAIGFSPRSAEFHVNLGLVYQALKRPEEAIACYGRALALAPDSPDAHNNLGLALRMQGKPDEAARCYRRAIERTPDFAEAHSNLGRALQELGKLDEAAACCRRALELSPELAGAHYNLGNVLQEQGRLDEAAACYRQALRRAPDSAPTHNNLGNTLLEQGKLDLAAACCRRAVELDPDLAPAQASLGNVLAAQGKPDEAIPCYRRALDLDPDCAVAHYGLGNGLKARGELDSAAACYRRAIHHQPALAQAHTNLGNVLQEQGKLDEAVPCYRRALELSPRDAHACYNLGSALQQQGLTDEAVALFDRALEIEPSPANRYRRATCLPLVYRSIEHLDATRRRLVQDLDALVRDGVRFDPRRDVLNTLFALAYQGRDDRAIHRQAAGLWSDAAAIAGPRPRSDGRIRVGFLSRFLRDHTIGHLGRGVIAHLSRKKFLVHLFALGRADDPIVDFLRRHADRFQNLPLDVAGAARAVAGDRLDVLCYLDLGMDPVAQGLAHLRLAPVQCATWGHPVTTGLPTIDYFISSALLEDADAQQHYTETLVRLETLGLYLYRPELSGPAPSRADFGLPGDKHLYACLQSLPKLHPDFDLLAGRILRRDPQAELVLLSGPSAEGERLLRQRFAASIPDVQQRIRFVPRQTAAGYLRLTACMDVLLDPPSFSGGKTSYEALALGRPVVTLPSPYLRGRITYGMYRAMGVYDCLAGTPAEYVEMALRLGTDADYRRAVGDKIRSAAGRLFEDLAAVRAWEEFLVRAAERGYTR